MVYSSLANPRTTKEVLASFGISTKYSLGQNFLINDAIIKKICDLSQVGSQDCVLEVGPGIGTLSLALLRHADKLISVERDQDLPQVLAHTLAEHWDAFTLISKDALDLEEADLGGASPNKFIANLPYAVAATLILDYFQRFESLQSACVMVQSEVADRICADKGTKNYGAYSVKLSLHVRPVGRFQVSPSNFFPPPRVESAVIKLERRDDELSKLSTEERASICTMCDAAFASRRKTIANSCKTYFAAQGPGVKAMDAQALACLFLQAGIDPKRRGESLDLNEFVALGLAYHRYMRT